MKARALAMLAITWLGFGSVYTAIKIGVSGMPALPLASLRFGAAGLLLAGVAIALERHRFEPLRGAQWRTTIVMGCVMAFLNGSAFSATTTMDSWVVAVLIATIPLWSFLFSVVTLRRRAGFAEFAGVAGGLLGIVVLAAPGGGVHIDIPNGAARDRRIAGMGNRQRVGAGSTASQEPAGRDRLTNGCRRMRARHARNRHRCNAFYSAGDSCTNRSRCAPASPSRSSSSRSS